MIGRKLRLAVGIVAGPDKEPDHDENWHDADQQCDEDVHVVSPFFVGLLFSDFLRRNTRLGSFPCSRFGNILPAVECPVKLFCFLLALLSLAFTSAAVVAWPVSSYKNRLGIVGRSLPHFILSQAHRHRQTVLRPRDADVTEPAFLVDCFSLFGNRAMMRQDVFFQTRQDRHSEIQGLFAYAAS